MVLTDKIHSAQVLLLAEQQLQVGNQALEYLCKPFPIFSKCCLLQWHFTVTQCL